jgi:hypothetical protein
LCERVNVNGSRHYRIPDGNRVPSVTTILDRTKPKEKIEILNAWRARVGHQNAQAITTEAANRGTRMHSYLEHYIINGVHKERGSNPFSWASHAMANTIIEQGLINVDETWGVEVNLYFPKIYAGTTDCVGIHRGIPSILDFKQSNRVKKEEWIDDYKLQLCAYAEAHNEVYGTNINKGVILMCVKPELDTQGQIVKPPQYQEFVIDGAEFERWTTEWWRRVEQYYLLNS